LTFLNLSIELQIGFGAVAGGLDDDDDGFEGVEGRGFLVGWRADGELEEGAEVIGLLIADGPEVRDDVDGGQEIGFWTVGLAAETRGDGVDPAAFGRI